MDEQLEFPYLDRRRSFCALFNLEAYTITFRQALKTRTFDRTMVNKDILAAILERDESETFLVVKPLYGTLRHFFDFLLHLEY